MWKVPGSQSFQVDPRVMITEKDLLQPIQRGMETLGIKQNKGCCARLDRLVNKYLPRKLYPNR